MQWGGNGYAAPTARRNLLGQAWRTLMKWVKPVVREYCVGMEVTSYESAEIEPDTLF